MTSGTCSHGAEPLSSQFKLIFYSQTSHYHYQTPQLLSTNISKWALSVFVIDFVIPFRLVISLSWEPNQPWANFFETFFFTRLHLNTKSLLSWKRVKTRMERKRSHNKKGVEIRITRLDSPSSLAGWRKTRWSLLACGSNPKKLKFLKSTQKKEKPQKNQKKKNYKEKKNHKNTRWSPRACECGRAPRAQASAGRTLGWRWWWGKIPCLGAFSGSQEHR